MKFHHYLVATLMMFAMFGASMNAAASDTKKAYACHKCEVASMKAGTCECGEKMKEVNGRIAYVCMHCMKSSKVPGHCTMCKGELKKMLITYSCEACDATSPKPGRCTKCKGALHKHIIPFKK
ncbi:MAG: hypothetical protein ACR2HJ_04780 [Fimbriimonadales bacterium]